MLLGLHTKHLTNTANLDEGIKGAVNFSSQKALPSSKSN